MNDVVREIGHSAGGVAITRRLIRTFIRVIMLLTVSTDAQIFRAKHLGVSLVSACKSFAGFVGNSLGI